MERILLVVNASKPDFASVEFAIRIAAMARTKLTALFLESVSYEPFLLDHPDAFTYSGYLLQANSFADTKADIDKVVSAVGEACQFAGIGFDMLVGNDEPVQQTIYESRFADYLVLDPGLNLSQREESLPSDFVREVLARAECPVLLSPKEFVDVEEVVFCYDGSASSVFAIKQFTTLLPQFRTKHALLLEVFPNGKEEFSVSDERIMLWLNMHYPSVDYKALQGHAKDELFNYLFLKTKKIIVLGAYGRSMLSKFFRESHADALIRMVDLPLFITHH